MRSQPAIARAQALEAGGRSRLVGRARLLPACEDDAAQMRFAVEDALNTADFGDAGRLVLVRRLRLADLPPRASPAWVAHAMEQAWRALALRAVPALEPAAAGAQAVFFASRFEARMGWLAQVAQGATTAAAVPAPGEWFWPAALPELKALPPPSIGAAIERVMEAALRDGEPAVVDALQRWSDAPLVALARALPVRLQGRLLQAVVSSQASARSGSTAAQAAPTAQRRSLEAPPTLLAVAARRLAAWAPLDEAAAKLVAALWLQPVLRRAPSRDEVTAVASRALGIGSAAHSGPECEPHASHPLAGRRDRQRADGIQPAGEEAVAAPHPAAAEPALPEPPSAPTLARIESGLAPRAPPTAKAPRLAAPLAWPWLAEAAFTPCGGLMLVLNVLRALRFDRWLERAEADDPQEFVQSLLVHCLDLAGAPEDDPQRRWLRPSPTPMGSIRLWTVRLRRTLRRHARMDLADLVRRPAHVSATPTHVDVVFVSDDVDMRLRRLGLDADPGWVPWFGRIVHLHFIEAALLPQVTEDSLG